MAKKKGKKGKKGKKKSKTKEKKVSFKRTVAQNVYKSNTFRTSEEKIKIKKKIKKKNDKKNDNKMEVEEGEKDKKTSENRDN
jgi:hypothetical protein